MQFGVKIAYRMQTFLNSSTKQFLSARARRALVHLSSDPRGQFSSIATSFRRDHAFHSPRYQQQSRVDRISMGC